MDSTQVEIPSHWNLECNITPQRKQLQLTGAPWRDRRDQPSLQVKQAWPLSPGMGMVGIPLSARAVKAGAIQAFEFKYLCCCTTVGVVPQRDQMPESFGKVGCLAWRAGQHICCKGASELRWGIGERGN